MGKFAMQKTRSGPSPFVSRLREELESAKGRASSLARKARESRIPRAVGHGGVAVGAAALTGAAKGAYGSDEFMGIPLDPIVAAAAIAAGIALDNEWLVASAAGPLSVYASGWVEDFVSDWMEG